MEAVHRLLRLMARLRDPEYGCPWDQAQDFHTIAPHTVEEAYEVADAIERGDMEGLRDELGDLLLQVIFHAQMAHEAERFDFRAVAEQLEHKLVRRHPHVFGDEQAEHAEGVARHWEAVKEQERRERGEDSSALDGIATALPALLRAAKLQRRAARVGFDWPDHRGALAKVHEEISEVEAEIGGTPERLEAEIGDLLFAVVNLARHLDVDAETALRRAGQRFETRFRRVEAEFDRRGEALQGQPIEALEAAWQRAKG
ncbi:MAG: nucleoside triphosphate pyrophosphohydrolase [Halorhodospira sp.]